MQEAIKESFSVEISYRIASTNISGNVDQLLLPFYKYLTQFSKTHDICSLPDVIDTLLRRLAKQLFHEQVLNKYSMPCFEETLTQYNAKYVRSIMNLMEPLLGRLRYLITAYTYRNKITEFMNSYQPPSYCVKSLMLMTFCSTCTLHHGKRPCHNLCINTIQGCLIHFADLHLSVKQMVKLLKKMQSQLYLNSNINHVGIKLQRYILGLKNDSALIKQKVCLPL